jgi:hypothetical protein
VNCCEPPSGIVVFCGLIAIETSAAAFTVKVAIALTGPELAPIIVVPAERVEARPAAPDVLLIVATLALVELQCAV